MNGRKYVGSKIEDAAGGGQQRKGANAARTLDLAAGEKIFESQAEKQAQAEKSARRSVKVLKSLNGQASIGWFKPGLTGHGSLIGPIIHSLIVRNDGTLGRRAPLDRSGLTLSILGESDELVPDKDPCWATSIRATRLN